MIMKRTVFTVSLILVFAFVFSACGSLGRAASYGIRQGVFGGVGSSGSAASTGSAPPRAPSGSTQTVPWPSDTSWARYGLEGLQQPPGTSVAGAALYMGYYYVNLVNGGRPAFDNIVAQIEKKPGARLINEVMDSEGIMMGFSLQTGNIVNVIYILTEETITIQAYPYN
jgi:hypothetical protein